MRGIEGERGRKREREGGWRNAKSGGRIYSTFH